MTWIRRNKKFQKPRKMYDKIRIEEENGLVKKYGLKNKREIWKAKAKIDSIRKQAKRLITSTTEEQERLYKKLQKIGINVKTISDVLALNYEDWLKRRLQSVLIAKNMAKSKGARQLITHKHVTINGKVVNIPSYIVKIDEESSIEIIGKNKGKTAVEGAK